MNLYKVTRINWLSCHLIYDAFNVISSVWSRFNTFDKGKSNPYNWGRLEELADHVERHAPDFGDISESEYAKMTNAFYNNRANYNVKVDKKGTIRV